MKKNQINCRKFKSISMLVSLFSILILVASCSKKSSDDSSTPDDTDDDNKSVKITIAITSPVDASDYISFVAVGAASDMNVKTLWKVNGETQNNQQGISLGRNDFTGDTKTYVLESATPFQLGTTGIQFINYGQDLKFSLKIEVNGKTVVEEANKTLSGDGVDFSKDYNY